MLEKEKLIQKLQDKQYTVIDMTDNEMAKLHIRHMVGGHAHHVENERLLRFIFPERPGALLHFLSQIGQRWNISLFHYRNNGAAFGRILVGLQVVPTELDELQDFLNKLGYPYWNENENPAYKIFLG